MSKKEKQVQATIDVALDAWSRDTLKTLREFFPKYSDGFCLLAGFQGGFIDETEKMVLREWLDDQPLAVQL